METTAMKKGWKLSEIQLIMTHFEGFQPEICTQPENSLYPVISTVSYRTGHIFWAKDSVLFRPQKGNLYFSLPLAARKISSQ